MVITSCNTKVGFQACIYFKWGKCKRASAMSVTGLETETEATLFASLTLGLLLSPHFSFLLPVSCEVLNLTKIHLGSKGLIQMGLDNPQPFHHGYKEAYLEGSIIQKAWKQNDHSIQETSISSFDI